MIFLDLEAVFGKPSELGGQKETKKYGKRAKNTLLGFMVTGPNLNYSIMENMVSTKELERKSHLIAERIFKDLKNHRERGEIAVFNKLLLKVMPNIKRYIQKRLKRTIANEELYRGRYMAEDFIDELFVEVYDCFNEVENAKDFYPWLFKKADELFEDRVMEEEFEMLFFDNIDEYSRAEWDAMEEKYSTDGDGDFVMLEELDDISYQQKKLVLKQIFLEDESAELMAKIDKDLEAKNIQKHINTVLYQLPTPMQAIFELYTEHQFSLSEIAMIRNRSVAEVEKLLEAANKGYVLVF